MATDIVTYGVRGPDARNTVVTASSRQSALDMLLPGDRLMESFDGGQTWGDGRARIVDGELRDHGSSKCDDCGDALIMPGWLCYDCAQVRDVEVWPTTTPGQVYEPCGDQLARIRVVEYTPGSNRAYVVDAADGRFPRSILVQSLHSTGTTGTGKPRRTGYRLVQDAS